jgi:hypothetical protein
LNADKFVRSLKGTFQKGSLRENNPGKCVMNETFLEATLEIDNILQMHIVLVVLKKNLEFDPFLDHFGLGFFF